MTLYHVKESCNKCGCENKCITTDKVEGVVSECSTECSVCGFKDYWAHGYFESSGEMKSNCKKYYTGIEYCECGALRGIDDDK